MKIVADENMPLVEEFFGAWGEIIRVPGREITPEHVADASLLLVRSITRVNQALLSSSKVQFVGTATIGTDHIDQGWLADQGIGFSAAPGCNAEGVVQYVLSVLDLAADKQQRSLTDYTVGIVGVGNVGGRLYRRLSALGVECRLCDPFVKDSSLPLCSLDELLGSCDAVTLHTPITQTGEYPSYHLLGSKRLQALNPGTVLINSSRGAVVDNRALFNLLQERQDLFVALDVWEHEPEIDLALMRCVDLASPHIAGYSLEGKLRGTAMIYEAACRFYNRSPEIFLPDLMPKPEVGEISFGDLHNPLDVGSSAARILYDVRKDDFKMRHRLSGAIGNESVASGFDWLRKHYPVRREPDSLRVLIPAVEDVPRQWLLARGFNVSEVVGDDPGVEGDE